MKTFIAALPPAAAVIAMLLVAGVPIDASPPAPDAPIAEADVPSEIAAPVAGPFPAPRPVPPEATTPAPVPAEEDDPAVRAVEEAHRLVDRLTAIAESSDQPVPGEVVDDVAALLTRRPETEDVFVESMKTAGRTLRVYYSHAFRSVRTAPQLRRRLLRTLRETDPDRIRLKRILANPSSILPALTAGEDSGVRRDLIHSLKDHHLADPDVFAAVVGIARSDPEDRVRSTAIFRLGKLDTPEARRFLLDLVRDRTKPLADRQVAAMRLRDRPTPEAVQEFIQILRQGDSAPLVRHSAIGLQPSVGQPEATDALVGLLVRKDGDPQARQNAAEALANGFQQLEEPSARSYVVVRVRGADYQLENEEGAESLRAYTKRILR